MQVGSWEVLDSVAFCGPALAGPAVIATCSIAMKIAIAAIAALGGALAVEPSVERWPFLQEGAVLKIVIALAALAALSGALALQKLWRLAPPCRSLWRRCR